MSPCSRALLFGLAVSLLGTCAVACTNSDNGGVIQGPAPTTTSTTPTTAGSTSSSVGTLAPG